MFDNFKIRSIRSFTATLGPAGGKRGYAGITGHVSNGLAWYINGLMIPELWLRRGLTYAFKVINKQLKLFHYMKLKTDSFLF